MSSHDDDDLLSDPYAKKKVSSRGIPALLDPDEREDTDRPLRTEDLIPRHGGNGSPKLWLPDGSKMKYYGRPSGWGEPGDNSERLALWKARKTVSGYLDTGQQGLALRAERSVLAGPDEDKDGHDKINDKALRLVFDSDRMGTMKHKMTEKVDLAIPFTPVPEFEYVLDAWARLTRFMEIVTLPTGQPGVECFVALDAQRLDQWGEPMYDETGLPVMIRLAGTFDRLFRYTPCDLCGRCNYIADLKTSSVRGLIYAQRKTGIQLGIYSRSKLYVPWADGRGADRYDLPDVCPHRGIVISIPPEGEGEPSMQWVDIARGIFRAVSLIPQIKDHQRETDWLVEFTPAQNVWAAIDRAQTQAEVSALYQQFPGEHWDANSGALTQYAIARIAAIRGEIES